MKNRIFLLLICFLLSPIVTSHATVILSESFDSYVTGSPPSSPWENVYWDWTTPTSMENAANHGVTLEINDAIYYGSSGKSAHFLDSSPTYWVWSEYALPQYTELTMEYYMRSDNSAEEGVAVRLYGDHNGDGYAASFRDNGFIEIWGGWGWQSPELLSYTEETWYYVSTSINTLTNTQSFYIEDMNTHDSAYTTLTLYHQVVDYIDMAMMDCSGSRGTDTYIDQLTISTGVNPVPEPTTMLLLSAGIVGLAAFRKKFKNKDTI